MPLIDVRKQFVEYTGRYDLVLDTIDYDNNGADIFITAGQRWLDRTFEVNGSKGRDDSLLEVGSWFSIIPEVRVVESVWVSTTLDYRYPLEYLPMDSFRRTFAKNPIGVTNGRITYYTPVFFQKIPESYDAFIDAFGSSNYIVATPVGYNGLLFMPPTDIQVNLEIHGKFYQPKLQNNTDTNLWSEAYPQCTCPSCLSPSGNLL